MNDKNKVSVYIPTHNRQNLVKNAVMSVLNQSYKNIEIIIVNDGSSDNTQAVLEQLATSYSNIKILRNDTPKGAPYSRNLAIKSCSGYFVTGLDDDDLFYPDRILDFIREFTDEFSFLSSSYTEFNGKDKTVNFNRATCISFDDIKVRNYIGNQIFTLKSRMIALNGYDLSFHAWQDYELWFRLIKQYGPAKIINNASYEVNTANDRERITSSSNAYLGYKQFVNKHKDALSTKEKTYQRINDLYNRKVKVSILETLKFCINKTAASRIIKLYLLSHFPKTMSRIIQLITNYK
ncbi:MULTISPECIES: glycosyltransferase [Colwellia]|nr:MULTISPECIES: glycosyltransferase [Colwellia]